jgi:eukaryotic-like serine/threonine-protein kinase
MGEVPTARAIFDEALGLTEPERSAYLDLACGPDAALRTKVEELLEAYASAGPFLAAPTASGAAAAGAPGAPAEGPGTTIGRYRLIEPLGEGGFGVVFLAEQATPIARRVALKVIKLGMDTRQVIARFEAERQALAMMDHPHIAKVLDAGATDAGRPYFVMELVTGEPITRYCDTRRLAVPQRLGLFVQVCEAVQHAHQKGIIHRDLKPGNILVGTQDGRPHAKVVDFGIAKATAAGPAVKTLFTEHRVLMGTPEYMSPEQADASLDIDTRTDVYSLGVLLYELLTGTTPFEASRLRAAAYAEIQRIIRTEEPERPSARLGRGTTHASADARPGLSYLTAAVRGDLDWITMKCLSKDRTRRYDSAGALAMDLERHLRSEPVCAAPPSALYRANRLLRRHRGPFLAAGLVIALLVAGVVVSSLGFSRAAVNAARFREMSVEAQRGARIARNAEHTALESEAEALKQRDAAAFEAYIANILAAEASLALGEPKRLRTRLEACPPALRGWEWLYLDARADSSLLVLRHSGAVLSGDIDSRGQRVITGSADLTAALWDISTGRQRAILPGGSHQVAHVAFSPAGDLALTASIDGSARVWASATGAQIASVCGRPIRCAAFSPTGDRVVIGLSSGAARVWESATGAELCTLSGHGADLNSVCFDPSGERVATASNDGTARVWNARTGAPLAVLHGHSLNVITATFDGKGLRIVTTSQDGTARIWDAQSGAEARVLRGHENRVQSASFSPDGVRVLTASADHTARVWHAATGNELLQLRHDGSVAGAAFSPDGSRIVTASADRTARVWDAMTGTLVSVLRGHDSALRSAAFSPSGDRILTCSLDRTARIWDPTTPDAPMTLPHAGRAEAAPAISPGSDRLVTVLPSGEAIVRDAHTGEALCSLHGHELQIRSVNFSHSGRRIVTASDDRTARVWDAFTGRQLAILRGHQDVVVSAVFDPEERSIVTGSTDRTARVWDAASGAPIGIPLGHEGAVRSACFDPQGARIITASADRKARVWDAASSRQLTVCQGHSGAVVSAIVNPAGDRIATASDDGTARVWEAASGRELHVLRGHIGQLRAIAFDPAGSRIVGVGSQDSSAHVWSVETGALQFDLEGHDSTLSSASFSPVGDRIVTASGDKTARIWDAATGKELLSLRGHSARTFSAVFSPSGDRVITASADGTVRVWESIPYRLRAESLSTARRAREQMQQALSPEFVPDGDLDAITERLAANPSLDEVHRRAGLAVVQAERLRRTPTTPQ